MKFSIFTTDKILYISHGQVFVMLGLNLVESVRFSNSGVKCFGVGKIRLILNPIIPVK